MGFLEEEFSDLPPALALALRDQLAYVIRRIVAAKREALANPSKAELTDSEISSIIYSIIDLASRLKHPRSIKS